jgi:signal transduction histidine kinase
MKWLSVSVIVYMIAALLWWSVLLLKQNKIIYEQAIKIKGANAEAFSVFTTQKNMIIGEGFVFAISLLIGFYLIYRALQREISVSKNQSNFLLSVSHELKSPLTSINLVLDTIKKRDLDKPTTNELIQTATTESKRLQDLIDSILLTSQLDFGHQYHIEEVNLQDMMDELIKLYTLPTARAHISFENKVAAAVISADKAALKIALNNLIENAIKYSQGLAQIQILIDKKGDKILLKIADQGIGISKEEKEKVFNKFYRVGDEKVRTSKGTGLGLYIVKKIVTDMHGTIVVENNTPRGTAFILTFQNQNVV